MRNHPLNIGSVTEFETNYANQRNISFLGLFQSRPLAELREAIDLFRTLHYKDAIEHLIENILSQRVSQDYYHMALCYISRSFARLGDIHNAKLVLGEAKRVHIPFSYMISATEMMEDAEKDIQEAILAHS